MFVKLRDDLIVNTDYIASVSLSKGKPAILHMAHSQAGETVSPTAIGVLLDLLGVSQAFDFNPDPAKYEQTLSSKLAVILRDTQPGGATVQQLSALANSTEELTMQTLLELRREGVTVISLSSDPVLWFHASHAPACNDTEFCRFKLGHIGPCTGGGLASSSKGAVITPIPDLSGAGVVPVLSPAADSES